MIDQATKERFYSKVGIPAIEDRCWSWLAGKSSDGYGSFFFRNYISGAHRASWEIHNGDIPDGLLVLHRCDNPECCNPKHLFLGTHTDNALDKVAKGRHTGGTKMYCKRGHPLFGDNLYITPSHGLRSCRQCTRMHGRIYDAKRSPRKRAA